MHNHQHHNHSHGPDRIGWAFCLNAGFTVIEFIGGVLTNSTAIMADAIHDLGDTLSIGSAWVLERLSRKDPDEVFTYGYRRLSLFGALINGIILILGSGWVLLRLYRACLIHKCPWLKVCWVWLFWASVSTALQHGSSAVAIR